MSRPVSEREVASNMLEMFWEVVNELADINIQRRRWLENEKETFESSYVEDYHAIVDNINFDLIAEHAEHIGVGPHLMKEMLKFRKSFLDFDRTIPDPYAVDVILSSPHWSGVVEAAKSLLLERG